MIACQDFSPSLSAHRDKANLVNNQALTQSQKSRLISWNFVPPKMWKAVHACVHWRSGFLRSLFFFPLSGKGSAFSNEPRPLALSLETSYFLSQPSTYSSWNCFCVYNLIKTMMLTLSIIQTIKLLQWGKYNDSVC